MKQGPQHSRQQPLAAASKEQTTHMPGYLGSGAVAGAVSALVFTLAHDLFISDIWNMLGIMMMAGAICGLCIGWSYGRLVDAPSVGSWLGYNLLYVALFGLLGAASVVVFDPVTTLAKVIEDGGPIDELIRMALPMTVLFALAAVAAISRLFGRRRSDIGPIFFTVVVLVVSLGLNVSAIGLVDIPRDSLYLVAELFGLIVVINVTFAATFVALQRELLTRTKTARPKQHETTPVSR